MRTPIAQALAWPERISSGVAPLELARIGSLNFFAPDLAPVPGLYGGFDALTAGGTPPAILNPANEVAVGAFLERKIGFLDIARACQATMRRLPATPISSLADALDADREARAVARELLNREQPQQLPA